MSRQENRSWEERNKQNLPAADGAENTKTDKTFSTQQTAAAGIKFDGVKPDMSLIPAAAALEEAAVWTFGKAKYDSFNWHKGLEYNRLLSAMERHLNLLKAGIDIDLETQRHHAAAIRCGAAMIIQFHLEQRTELDNRLKLSEETKNKIEKMSKGELVWQLLK